MAKTAITLGALAAVLAIAAAPGAAEARKHHTYRHTTYRHTSYRNSQSCQHAQQNSGTTGAIVGGLGGALAGNAISGGGGKLGGTLIGAGVGAYAGHKIGRNAHSC